VSIISKKICIIGESEVGKHSLIRRFVDHQFSDEYSYTLGVTIARKTMELPGLNSPDKLHLQLLLWNITGRSKFQAIASSYLRGSSAALVVADVSRPETIERLVDHIQLFLSINPQGWIVVALNKSDLIDEAELTKLVQRIQLKDWEQVTGIYQTSAKNGSYVEEVFQHLARISLMANG